MVSDDLYGRIQFHQANKVLKPFHNDLEVALLV